MGWLIEPNGPRPLEYDIRTDDGHVGRVEVHFSELPVSKWFNLSNAKPLTRFFP